jgi:hypothetical protein
MHPQTNQHTASFFAAVMATKEGESIATQNFIIDDSTQPHNENVEKKGDLEEDEWQDQGTSSLAIPALPPIDEDALVKHIPRDWLTEKKIDDSHVSLVYQDQIRNWTMEEVDSFIKAEIPIMEASKTRLKQLGRDHCFMLMMQESHKLQWKYKGNRIQTKTELYQVILEKYDNANTWNRCLSLMEDLFFIIYRWEVEEMENWNKKRRIRNLKAEEMRWDYRLMSEYMANNKLVYIHATTNEQKKKGFSLKNLINKGKQQAHQYFKQFIDDYCGFKINKKCGYKMIDFKFNMQHLIYNGKDKPGDLGPELHWKSFYKNSKKSRHEEWCKLTGTKTVCISFPSFSLLFDHSKTFIYYFIHFACYAGEPKRRREERNKKEGNTTSCKE